MENERPKNRHSLLPQRSTSSANILPEDTTTTTANKLAPPPKPKQRDVSPSKLPVGGLRRTQSIRPSSAAPKQSNHKSQQSSASLSRDGMPSITPVRTAPSDGNMSPRKQGTLGKSSATAASHGKQMSVSMSNRPGTSHRKTASVVDGAAAGRPGSAATANVNVNEAKTMPPPRTTSRILANVKVQRPASTAHQRPSSPKKAPKAPPINKFALLTTATASGSKPVQDAKLELLHLHTLHKETHKTKAQWTQSAKDHYEKHFRRLIQLEEDLKASEMEFVEQQNAAALIDWCREVCAATGESKTKSLSSILTDMWLLVSPGGRYTAAVSAFEDWYAMVERELDHRLHDCHVDIMEGLGDGWKAEIDALMSTLCRMSDDLENLGPAIEPSDLARCINVLMTMLANMLEELVLVRDVEGTVVQREGSFVKDRIEGLSARVSGER